MRLTAKSFSRKEEENTNVGGLSCAAQLANFLAKQLTGPNRTLAYRLKAQICSVLILEGRATANGVCADGIVALTIAGERPCRLHIRVCHLWPEAQVIVNKQASLIPAVAPIAEQLAAKETLL